MSGYSARKGGLCVMAAAVMVLAAAACATGAEEDDAGKGLLARYEGGAVTVRMASDEEDFWHGPMQLPVPGLAPFCRPAFPWSEDPAGYARLIASRDHFLEAAAGSGVDRSEEYRDALRGAEAELLVRLYKLARIDAVPEEEVRAYYESHLAEWTTPEQFLVRNVFVQCDMDSAAEKEPASARAEEALAALRAGEDFDAVERRYSTRRAEEVGEVYLVRSEGRTHAEVWKAVQELEPGEISDVLEVRHGYMIVKLIDRRPEKIIAYENLLRHCASKIAHARMAAETGGGLDPGRLAGKAREAGIAGTAEFTETMADYGRRVLAAMEVGRQVAQELAGVDVTEDMLRREYETNPVFGPGWRRTEIRIINIPPELEGVTEPDKVHFAWEAARERCQELRRRAGEGEDFAELARRYSVGYNGAEGGFLPARDGPRDQVIDTAVGELSIGEISEPVRHARGYYLIKLEGEEEPRRRPFAEARDEVLEIVTEQAAREIQDRLVGAACDQLHLAITEDARKSSEKR